MSKFITCAETGSSSCQPRDEEYGSSMKPWRCDLTALSQLHNLYFVACNATILVHQPEFPDQSLSEPKLVLRPPVSAPNLEPYIDLQDPHSITRLLVDYLGNDEIILATCDDGDVIAYRIEEIQRTLDLAQQSLGGEKNSDFSAHVRVFLHHNVGLSAWGLAIHREARMIAISANTHKITVLAFALASEGHGPHEESFMHTTMGTDFPVPRRRDHVFILRASHNVPAVSFNNNKEDTGGRWLFASCITGENTLWDLHNPRMPARALRMGWCSDVRSPNRAPPLTEGPCRCLGAGNYPHATWNAMFLDPRSAHEVSTSEPRRTTSNYAPYFDDADLQQQRFWPMRKDPRGVNEETDLDMGDEHSASEELLVLESGSESSEGGTDYDGDAMSMDEEDDYTLHDAQGDNDSNQHTDDDGDSNDEDNSGDEEEAQDSAVPTLPSIQHHLQNYTDVVLGHPQATQPTPLPLMAADFPQFPISFDEIAHLMQDGDENDSDAEDESDISLPAASEFTSRSRPRANPYSYLEIKDGPAFQGYNSHQPCLVVSKDDIFLLQSPFTRLDDEEPDHTLVLRSPLCLMEWKVQTTAMDRLCFSTQIPELGIFIVASPIGRAAIFALTKSYDSTKGFTYGFHLEYVLLLNEDKETAFVGDVLAERCMVGLAVGPVQGMLGREDGGDRTWRLLAYFANHRVVSYELKRKRAGGPGLGDLVV